MITAAVASPPEDISFPAPSSPCGHVPCVILLKGSKSLPHVQWLMCLALHEMSLYWEAPVSRSYQGAVLTAFHAFLPDWLTVTNVALNESHFITAALWKAQVPKIATAYSPCRLRRQTPHLRLINFFTVRLLKQNEEQDYQGLFALKLNIFFQVLQLISNVEKYFCYLQ